MTIGPVQLLVLGFDHPNFQGRIRAELERLRDDDMIRVIDFLGVYKDVGGEVTVLKETQLDEAERVEFGAVVGALVGIGAGLTAEEGAELGAEVTTEDDDTVDELAWDVVAEIPEGSAAALVLLEHRWAIPLREALADAGGVRLASEFVSPLDLVEVGLVAAQEAEALAARSQDAV
ncbi:MAG: hypothetical protein J0I34_19165 [Pseudonocardia sp.]|uniref:hypothetical protein n=1 Tax=unclassified Pseudonocardia TaxID=2619320 RepID=UPI00086EB7DE|nr:MULTISPECIES: hypothetical protein [unclassified Pseudonocardia]MBN9110887.1 hypothetical protein [Pseudonocardia sp.]ODU26824.1 MAG: hypothetical protein ABS80_05525 [Pseudonocardia sp. SCN 72-51]ODV05454.1 MAG: hypothetical protein ABT15_17445 [Pseudonocardia sp. SCN 73-27]